MRYGAISLAYACIAALAAYPLVSRAAGTGESERGAVSTEATQGTGEPATWITSDIEVKLQSLPKAYSCDALWYKLHGILLAVGARQYMAINPYYCGLDAVHGGRSPTVDLKFQTLRVLSKANARWAETSAETRLVRLSPGQPKILDPDDCALLEQLRGTLFAYLDMQVVASHFECSASRGAAHFALSIRALVRKPARASPN